MTKKLLILLGTSLSIAAMAQERVVTGRVTDKDGQSIPGVHIVVKDTTTGTVSDDDGKYSISIPEGATLVLSSVGLSSQELLVGTRSVLDVVMSEELKELTEVIVTAQGIKREEKTLGYAVQSLKGDDLAARKSDNFVTALSGQVAGIQIKSNTNFGGSSNVIIRGSSSLSGNNQPLYVVDGIPISNNNTNNAGQTTGAFGYDYGNASSDINSNDIETISVLKGAAATALYGARAANGVILITTKKGKVSQGLGLTVSSNFTVSTIDRSTMPDYQQSYGAGYGKDYGPKDSKGEKGFFDQVKDFDGDGVKDWSVPFREDASRGGKFDPNLMVYQYNSLYPESPYYNKATPWVAARHTPTDFFETGISQNHAISWENATEKSSYRLSYTRFDQKGAVPNSRIQRDNYFATASHNFRKNVKLTAQANYVKTTGSGRPTTGYSQNLIAGFRQWWQMNVDIEEQRDLYLASHKNITWNPVSPESTTPIYWDNPYWIVYENYETDERNRLIGLAQVDWEITKGLSFMGRMAIDFYNQLQEERRAVPSRAGEFGVGRPLVTSGYSRYSQVYTESNVDGILKYQKKFGPIDLTALAGLSMRRNVDDNVYASTSGGLATPGVYALSNSFSPMQPPEEALLMSRINGMYGSLGVGYKGFLYLDATIRRDRSSTLPKQNSVFIYPSVSSSFVFSELIDAPFIFFGKLRINYAEVGNNPPPLRVKDTYTILSPFAGNPLFTVNSVRGNSNYSKNNPDLKPEKSRSVEAGLEMNFSKGRLGFDVAVYKTNSFNQSLQLKISQSTGYDARWINAGEIQNSGMEVQLYGIPVKTENSRWNMRINWAKNRNQVVSLYMDESGQEVTNYQLATLPGGVSIAARKGEPYGAIIGSDYIYYAGQRVVNDKGQYEKTSTTDKLIGNATPQWTGGIRNTFGYKSWDFSVLIDSQYGGELFSLDMWYGTSSGLYKETAGLNELGNPMRDPLQKNPDGTYLPTTGGILYEGITEQGEPNRIRVDGVDQYADGSRTSPNKRYVYDASYVKLREVSLTYTIPKSILQKASGNFLQAASISMVGSNLWIIHKNLPYSDPEASQGSGNIQGWQSGTLPMTRNYGITLNLKF